MLTSPDERICLESRRHGIVLLRPLVQACALALAGGYALLRGGPWSVAGAVLAALGAGICVRAVWRWERTRVVVTTEKLYVLHGTLRRRAAAVRLSRVASVEIEQSLLGRLLGYGTLVAGDLELDHVPEPRRVFGLVERLCP